MSSSANSSSSSETPVPPGLPPLYEVACRVEIVLGTTTLKVRDCLGLGRHSIIRLAQSAGEDLQVMVNGIRIATAETVIVEDNTAVRITEIMPAAAEGTP